MKSNAVSIISTPREQPPLDNLDRALQIQAQTRQRNLDNLASIRSLKRDLDNIRDSMRAVRDHLVPQSEGTVL